MRQRLLCERTSRGDLCRWSLESKGLAILWKRISSSTPSFQSKETKSSKLVETTSQDFQFLALSITICLQEITPGNYSRVSTFTTGHHGHTTLQLYYWILIDIWNREARCFSSAIFDKWILAGILQNLFLGACFSFWHQINWSEERVQTFQESDVRRMICFWYFRV